MPTWADAVNTWQQKNSAALNAYTARYKKAQATGATGSDLYNLAQQGTTPDPNPFPGAQGQSQAKAPLAAAATAVKNTAPSPSPALSPPSPPPNNQLQASNDLGAALSGQPAESSYAAAKRKGTLNVSSPGGVQSYRNPRTSL